MNDQTAELPLVPSELLRLAAEDVRKVASNPNLAIDMTFWGREPRASGLACSVCLAGAVMVGTLGDQKIDALSPYNYNGLSEQLIALDCARSGNWWAFVIKMQNARMSRGLEAMHSPVRGDWGILRKNTREYVGRLAREDVDQLAADLEAWADVWEGDGQ